LPGKKEPPTLTLKVAPSVKSKLKSDTEGVKKAGAKKRKQTGYQSLNKAVSSGAIL